MFRKQQAKDAQILKNYEEELRDPSEFFRWQEDLKERDRVEKLKLVALRREQAKQSAIEAKDAIEKQKQDNSTVANMMREQGVAIAQHHKLEQDITLLKVVTTFYVL